ncbi:hypothetical protein Ancab_014909 [Ancistrocladus abbreviatus]
MSAGNATSTPPAIESSPASGVTTEEATARALHKRYEGLMMVRNKAIRGKGAWYWAHLEPLLVKNNETGLPKAPPTRRVRRRSTLKRGTCPNFTAATPRPISSVSPNSAPTLAVSAAAPPIDSPSRSPSTSLLPSPQSQPHNHRKRSSSSGGSGVAASGGGSVGGSASAFPPSSSYHHASPITMIDPSRYCTEVAYSPALAAPATSAALAHQHQQQEHLVLSGGKEDLGTSRCVGRQCKEAKES